MSSINTNYLNLEIVENKKDGLLEKLVLWGDIYSFKELTVYWGRKPFPTTNGYM